MVYLPLWLVIWLMCFVFIELVMCAALALMLLHRRKVIEQNQDLIAFLQIRVDVLQREKMAVMVRGERSLQDLAERAARHYLQTPPSKMLSDSSGAGDAEVELDVKITYNDR